MTHVQGLNQTIPNLRSNTEYYAGVQAVNSSGPGNWSNTLRVWTDRITPTNHRPYFLTDNNYSITVEENTATGQEIGDPIAARDPDGDILIYALEGADADHFDITSESSGGQVKTKDPLNHEEQSEYDLTIRVMDTHDSPARHALMISVTDVQEPGSVTLAPTQPTVAEEVTATLSEEDERTSASWQWAWAENANGPSWTDIDGATGPTYTPAATDRGRYLRATASYEDIDIGQSASAITSKVIDPTLESLNLSPVDINSFQPSRLNYAVGMANSPSQATVTAVASHSEARLSYSFNDADGGTDGRQVNLTAGINTLTITVTDGEVSDGEVSRDYQVTIGRGVEDEYGWKAESDLNTLVAAGNLSPRGIWSNTTTLWVVDDEAGKLMAYTLQTMAREDSRDIRRHEDNRTPRGAWSDGTTMWVADAAQSKLFGYPLQDSTPTQEFSLHVNNADPWGIWSDGSVIWVVDRSETKLFAYDLSTQARLPGRDIQLASGNSSPAGAWSDGPNIWVADDDGDKIYAYRMSDKTRDASKDFNTLQATGNTTPAGLWSDGNTLWVSDTGEAKVYAYNMPISNNADLRSITIDGESIQNPSSETETENLHYIETRPEHVTVSAEPLHLMAQVSILPQDADGDTQGDQVELGANDNSFTITVTAQNGTNTQTYTMTIIRPPGPPDITTVTPDNGSLTLEWDAPGDTGGVPADEIYYYDLRYIESDAPDKTSDQRWNQQGLIWVLDNPPDPFSYTLENLTNGVSYDLQIQSRSVAGYGEWSETITGIPSITRAPSFTEGISTNRSVPENSPTNTDIGIPVSATDPDPGNTLAYSIDSEQTFNIDAATGQLSTKEGRNWLDYETKQSHTVIVSVTDGLDAAGDADDTPDASITVTIDVENVDELGRIDLPQDTEGNPHRATVEITVPDPTDPDGAVSNITWQWARSTSTITQFTDITEATNATFTPTIDLIGSYLRVTATYTDVYGSGQTAQDTTNEPVADPPNEAPEISTNQSTFILVENTPQGTAIGEPFTATDPDEGDTLEFSLQGPDHAKFQIDENSGQLSTNSGLDYEDQQTHSITVVVNDTATSPLSDSMDVTITVTNEDELGSITISPSIPAINIELAATLTDPDGSIADTTWQWAQRAALQGSTWEDIAGATSASYTPTQTDTYLQVTARYTDGHSSGKSAVREIAISVTNTKPTFGTNPTGISIEENKAAGTNVGNPVAASDPNGDPITFSLRDTSPGSGHADSFSINAHGQAQGQITVATGVTLDHETGETYQITVEVTDGKDASGGEDTTKDAFLDLTITVTDVNEPGVVNFSNPYPQLGLNIRATLHDQDGLSASNESWQWARGDSGSWSNISGATSDSYTPTHADMNKHLRATVTYTDNTYGTGQTARGVTANPADPPITFTEESYNLYTFENSIAGAPLLEDLPAIQDANGEIRYSLSGDDSDKYMTQGKENGSVQILVENDNSLDHETEPQHSFTLTVTDDSDATHTTTVNVEIKDLIEDGESFSLPVGSDTITITWTRFPETNMLVARENLVGGARRPEYELNVQLIPCIEDHRQNWAKYDQYQLDLWLDGEEVKYRDPSRSQEWTAHNITNADNTYGRGTDPQCHPAYTDVWNDDSSIYALDTAHRLIKAYDLDQLGSTYTRAPSRDIPVGQDHYRSAWEVQGIWGDADTIWVTLAEQSTSKDNHIAAYDRMKFTRDSNKDIDLPVETFNDFYLVHDIWNQGDIRWTVDNNNQNTVFGRRQDNMTNIRTCEDGNTDTDNKISADASGKRHLRLTGQGHLFYTLNYESQNLDTISTLECPPIHTESEFDLQEIKNKPAVEPNGISTDDGLVMYFSFSPGQIRHISKIHPELVDANLTITIPENTHGVRDAGSHSVGPPFRVKEKQPIGQYFWHLEELNNSSNSNGSNNSTPCGETPDPGHDYDAMPFDCRSSGNRNQTVQILTRPEAWLDFEEKPTYSFTLKVADIEEDDDSVVITVTLEDVDEKPSPPGRPQISDNGQQSLRVSWNAVTLANGATPKTTLDQITGYTIEYTPEGETSQEIRVGGAEISVDGAGILSHTLTELKINTHYTIRVKAHNNHDPGDSDWSPDSGSRTLPNPGPTLDETNFSIDENTALVNGLATVEILSATDPDSQNPDFQDAITGYQILAHGNDHRHFELAQESKASMGSTATLLIKRVPNFEEQETYRITVRTTSGTGVREESTSEEVTITVIDLDEPPDTPMAPTISHERQQHLQVSWETPANTGPPINDYDVQYRVKDENNPNAAWTDHPFSGTGNTVTLSGLQRDTPYEFASTGQKRRGRQRLVRHWRGPDEGQHPPGAAGQRPHHQPLRR